MRIATLDEAREPDRAQIWTVFHNRMRELGYVQGQGYTVDARWGNTDRTRLQKLAIELAALKPDVIVTAGTSAALAAKRATSDIPIVFGGVAEP